MIDTTMILQEIDIRIEKLEKMKNKAFDDRDITMHIVASGRLAECESLKYWIIAHLEG